MLDASPTLLRGLPGITQSLSTIAMKTYDSRWFLVLPCLLQAALCQPNDTNCRKPRGTFSRKTANSIV